MVKSKSKGLSNKKKSTIGKNKLCRSGTLKKEKYKIKRKERRAEGRRVEHERQRNAIAKQEDQDEDPNEISAADMLEMIDKDDLQSMLAPFQKKRKALDDAAVAAESRVKKLLPIKDEGGWVKQEVMVPKNLTKALSLDRYKRKVKGTPEEDTKEEPDSGVGEETEIDEDRIDEFLKSQELKTKIEEGGVKSVAELLAHRNKVLQSKKISIGCIAMNIIEDPTKLTNLKFLISMMEEQDKSVAVTIRKYASLTILHVLHSIIPSYKIQETNIDKNTMKKDTYQIAQQEKELLQLYQKYLKSLEEFLLALKEEPKNFGLLSVCNTAIKCLGELMVQHTHFNYTVNIIQLLVPYLDHLEKELRESTYNYLRKLLENDKVGTITVEVVKRVCRLIKSHKYRVKPQALQILLHIRVSDMKNSDKETDSSRQNEREATHRDKLLRKLTREAMAKPSNKQKKERKKMAKIREEKAGFEATELMKVVNKKHSDILAMTFAIYFHILKNRPNSKLIGIVLEGLARFAHLINIEFFNDLLLLLSDFLQKGTLTQGENLHCIQTVFTILFGQGESLTVDSHRFYKHLYSKTFDMKFGGEKSEIVVYLRLLSQVIVGQRKRISAAKVLAFTKRLAMLTLNLFHQEAIPAMVILRMLIVTFSSTEALLDSNEDGCAGIFNPNVDDPEHSFPAATALWDLQDLQCHYHPVVQELAKHILGGAKFKDGSALIQLTKRKINYLFEDYDLTKLKFKPSLPTADVHIKTHSNFLASKRKKKRPDKDDDLVFENFNFQLKCEETLNQVEKESLSILSCDDVAPQNGKVIMVNGKIYIPTSKKKKIQKDSGKSGDCVNFYQSLIQNIH